MRGRAWLVAFGVFMLGCERGPGAGVPDQPIASEQTSFRVVTVASGLEHPWGMAFLPDGEVLVTERPGRMRIISTDGEISAPLQGLPDIHVSGQGGLLDVALDPDFENNRLIYFSYAAQTDDGAGTRVAQARLEGDRLEDVTVIFEGLMVSGSRHFGSRLGFDEDGYLYVTLGDRGDADRAQELSDLAGKVVRIETSGSIPADNPYVDTEGAAPAVFSHGHRNPQGLTRHPETGEIWTVEHGPRGGDELNVVRPGLNYGWPVITYGRAYSGLSIGEGTEKEGMEQPVHYWVPSISPSGMAFYYGEAFPAWQGDLFVGALSGQLLARLEIEDEQVVRVERLLEDEVGRIRDVRVGPDGYLYLLTDEEEGAFLRLEPA